MMTTLSDSHSLHRRFWLFMGALLNINFIA